MLATEKNLNFIHKFVEYCAEKLKLVGNINIILVNGKKDNIPSAGGYDPNTDIIIVNIKNRAMADCMRTLAHELTHMKQKQDGVNFPYDDESLQPYENEANVSSGKLVRFYGRKNKDIYTDLNETKIKKHIK
jgi:Zn-dependent peptidase ImmA (M78 family)